MAMETLVAHLAKSLVDNPDQIQVNVTEKEHSISITLKVASEDMGKIIGKHGRIANALRTVLKAAGARQHKKVYVEIVE